MGVKITVAGKPLDIPELTAEKRKTIEPLSERSYIEHLNHAQEIRDHLQFMSDIDKNMQYLESQEDPDPWAQAERDDEWHTNKWEFLAHIGHIQANLHYLDESRREELAGVVPPEVAQRVREIFPGCLTGYWQYLVSPF